MEEKNNFKNCIFPLVMTIITGIIGFFLFLNVKKHIKIDPIAYIFIQGKKLPPLI